MKRNSIVLLSAATLLFSSATLAVADESNDLAAALASGKTGINVRARYEHVDQDNFLENAAALTTRLRLNYRTGQWNGWTGFVEYDYLFHLLNDFNSGAGTVNVGEGKVALIIELATQKDIANNPVSYDAQYAHLSGLWSLPNGLSLGLAYESLGTDTATLQSFRFLW